MLPNFIVIGQAKCGTTTVCHHLSQHPQVFFSYPKEPWFFGAIGVDYTWEEYRALFDGAEGYAAVGEGSTSYTRPDIAAQCAEEIHSYIPDCRLIYLVRDPMARLLSDWKMRVREGRARPDDINHEIRTSPKLVTLGNYWHNLAPYRKLFPDDQILIVFLQDLARSPNESFERIWRHIGVDPSWKKIDQVDPKNAAGRHRREGVVLRTARRFGLLPALRAAVPESAREAVKGVVTSSFRYQPNWDEAVRADVEAQYREWSAPLLAHCGKPAEFWSTGRQNARRGNESGRRRAQASQRPASAPIVMPPSPLDDTRSPGRHSV